VHGIGIEDGARKSAEVSAPLLITTTRDDGARTGSRRPTGSRLDQDFLLAKQSFRDDSARRARRNEPVRLGDRVVIKYRRLGKSR
jgi:hypothetical protein